MKLMVAFLSCKEVKILSFLPFKAKRTYAFGNTTSHAFTWYMYPRIHKYTSRVKRTFRMVVCESEDIIMIFRDVDRGS